MVDDYVLFHDNNYVTIPLRDSIVLAEARDETMWSVRLGTGLLGRIDCTSGRMGPAGRNEVIIALGKSGLLRLVDLGAITCPTCQPESDEGFWETVMPIVKEKYALHDLDSFLDRAILPFDARRIDWETIVPITGSLPGRLYVPKGLAHDDLRALEQRFDRIGTPCPKVGSYDRSLPGAFQEYQIHDSLIS